MPNKCQKHNCELKPLLTTFFCPECEDEARVQKEIDSMLADSLFELEELEKTSPMPADWPYNKGKI